MLGVLAKKYRINRGYNKDNLNHSNKSDESHYRLSLDT